jgi:hypothetical protein
MLSRGATRPTWGAILNASVKGRTRSAERVEAHPQSLSLAKRL